MKRISIERLQNFLAKAEFEEAFAILLSETKGTPFYKESIRLSSNYYDLKEKSLRGLISQVDYNLTLNQLIKKIYDHIIKIESRQERIIYQAKYHKLFAAITIGIVLLITSLYVFISVLNRGSFLFDKRDWRVYKILKKGSFEYMIDNLQHDSKDSLSWCYGEKSNDCRVYGRLYNFEGAKKACAELGNGWRLPTKMEINDILGPLPIKADVKSMLGGGRSEHGEYFYVDEIGHYWTSSLSNNQYIWVMYVYGSQGVIDWFDSGDQRHGYSCRCIRSLE